MQKKCLFLLFDDVYHGLFSNHLEVHNTIILLVDIDTFMYFSICICVFLTFKWNTANPTSAFNNTFDITMEYAYK